MTNKKAAHLKLYRGLSSDEFQFATENLGKDNKRLWTLILKNRANGDFSYPHNFDAEILKLQKSLRLEYQYFTDSKTIAEGYARQVGGLLVELTIPLEEITKHFDIEFQNFGRRKKLFELVYCIKGSLLSKYAKRWKLKVGRK